MSAYACPIDGCDYTAPVAGSVKGHLSRKTTGEHEGESGPEYSDDELLQADEHPDYGGDPADSDDESADTVSDAGDADTEQVSEPDVASESTETDTAPSDSAASTDGGAGIVPEADAHTPGADGSDGSTAEPDECPSSDCANTEHFRDADQHLEDYRDRLEDQHVEALESGDHVCQVCGGVF